MADNKLNDVQEELLLALKWLDKFCRNNDISYSLHGGTLLGAIREKGFIPWDDDADVTFTREEYQKFEKLILHEKLDKEIIFDSDRRYPKLYYKQDDRPAVWIDIFVYDAISENILIQKFKKILLYYYMMILREPGTFEIITKTRKHSSVSILLMKTINAWGKHIPHEKKVQGAKRVSQRFGGSGKLIHRANDQKSGINEIHPLTVMSLYMMTPFEDTELMISVDYNEILKKSYGEDYMIPRKREDQTASDAAVIQERRAAEKFFEGMSEVKQ